MWMGFLSRSPHFRVSSGLCAPRSAGADLLCTSPTCFSAARSAAAVGSRPRVFPPADRPILFTTAVIVVEHQFVCRRATSTLNEANSVFKSSLLFAEPTAADLVVVVSRFSSTRILKAERKKSEKRTPFPEGSSANRTVLVRPTHGLASRCHLRRLHGLPGCDGNLHCDQLNAKSCSSGETAWIPRIPAGRRSDWEDSEATLFIVCRSERVHFYSGLIHSYRVFQTLRYH